MQPDPSVKASQPAAKSDNPSVVIDIVPPQALPKEIGGPKGPEPTRYGDWEKNGKCVDF